MQETTNKQTATPFMKIGAASRATGLSQYFLRQLCRDGKYCVKSGGTYYVNINQLLRELGADNGKEAQN